MAKLQGRFPKVVIAISIDQELLSLIQVIKNENGLSLSSTIETLCINGLKNSKFLEEARQ
jgi:hypothetical protein